MSRRFRRGTLHLRYNPDGDAAADVFALTRGRKALVFCNARARVERLTYDLNRLARAEDAYLPHHGSLHARERSRAESGLRSSAAAPAPHYTRARRDDFYECLRALIDDMGLSPGLMLAFAGPPEPLSDERAGFLSYQALADRVRSEVETVRLAIQWLDLLYQHGRRPQVRLFGLGEVPLDEAPPMEGTDEAAAGADGAAAGADS